MEYLVGERNLARNTQQSYRDAVRLLVVFVAAKMHKKVDELLVPDIDADLLRDFLRHIEEKRKCSISSRNQRLAAIHALAGFIAERCPEYLEWCAQLRAVKSKRSAPTPVCYLEKPEIDALLDAPTPVTKLGYRDRALLLFLYNSGARADEAANLCIEDLSLHSGADGALSSVCLHGKGGKVRICPLWASTTVTLRNLVAGRNGKERVFLNRRSEPLTRFGIHEIVTRYADVAMSRVPEMQKKRIGPHTIRHYLDLQTMSSRSPVIPQPGHFSKVSLDIVLVLPPRQASAEGELHGTILQKPSHPIEQARKSIGPLH
jgi:site-specific recombinase XerD